jgi:hypothetical protein
MSRSKKSPTPRPAPEPTAERPGALPEEVVSPPSPRSQQERESAEIFNALRRELGPGAFVTISRSHPGAGQHKHAYEGTLPLEECTIENITQIYGGGDFIVRGKTANGAFSGEERRFSISHSIPPKNPRQAVERKEPPQQDTAAIVQKVLDSTKAESSGIVELAKTILSRPAERQDNTVLLEVMKMTQETKKEMFELIAKMEANNQKNLRELVEALRRDEPAEPEQSHLEWLREQEEIDRLRGVKKGGASEDNGLVGLVKQLIVSLAPGITAKFAGETGGMTAIAAPLAQPNRGPATTVSPASTPINVAATPAAEATSPMPSPEIEAQIKQFRVAAISAATIGQDPYQFTSFVFSMVAPERHAVLYNTARAEDWIAQIFGADRTQADKHMKFLLEMRDCVLARALAAHAASSFATQAAPEQAARDFVDWAPESFADGALNLVEQDENWAEGMKEIIPQIDPAWLGKFRESVAHGYSGDEEPANVVEIETAAAPAASPKPASAAGAGGARKK